MNDLFDTDTPIARTTDPDTSHQAAARFNLTNRAKRQIQVLQLVSRYPYQTSGELARDMIDCFPELPLRVAIESPQKRLPDLERKALVKRVHERKCRDTGYKAWTWSITVRGAHILDELAKR